MLQRLARRRDITAGSPMFGARAPPRHVEPGVPARPALEVRSRALLVRLDIVEQAPQGRLAWSPVGWFAMLEPWIHPSPGLSGCPLSRGQRHGYRASCRQREPRTAGGTKRVQRRGGSCRVDGRLPAVPCRRARCGGVLDRVLDERDRASRGQRSGTQHPRYPPKLDTDRLRRRRTARSTGRASRGHSLVGFLGLESELVAGDAPPAA